MNINHAPLTFQGLLIHPHIHAWTQKFLSPDVYIHAEKTIKLVLMKGHAWLPVQEQQKNFILKR
jgi:hypothetical protein